MSFNWKNAKKTYTPEEYNKEFAEYVNSNPSGLSAEEQELFDYTKLNLQRSARIEKSYTPGNEITELITAIKEKQYWMVITENWCGDSAQNLPYLIKLAALNSNIEFKLVLRDTNPEVMDQYLTNGTKSIPVLVVFNENGDELYKWGPRPKEAQVVITQAKADGLAKKEMYEKLHLWYGRNRGAAIENEMLQLIKEHTN